MSLFDSASLVITPNGVKEDKLYAIKPTDGSGDLVVTRATTATRVNSDGLIEQVPYNLYLRSEEFDNASWAKSNATVTANATNSPIGNLTSDKVIASATTSTHFIVQQPAGAVSGVTATMSIFAKASELSRIQLLNNGGGLGTANFNLSAGTATLVNGVSASIENYGNGWYRCIMSYIPTITGSYNIQIRLADSSGNTTFLGNGTDGLFLWGAQLVTGTSAKEYFPTTDRLDVPRLDYTNSTCPSILVEPQRTNLVLQSNNFNTNWTMFSGPPVTPNSAISPQGIQNATTLNSSGGANDFLFQTIPVTIGLIYTNSFYIKNINSTSSRYRNVSNNEDVITWSGSTLVSISTGASFVEVGNGWYRVFSTATATATPFIFRIAADNTNTSKSVYIYGAQLELGSNATSYIPTVASTVTRNADVISKTGISSLIGQTQGTIYAEIDINTIETKGILDISADIGNFYRIRTAANGQFLFRYRTGGGTETTIASLSASNSQTGIFKIAFAYKNGDYASCINGVLRTSNISGISPIGLISEVSIGVNPSSLNDRVNSVIIFKERLSNEQLTQLTTP
jgi:hypothetical protein